MLNVAILFIGLIATFFGLYILTDSRFEAWATVWRDGFPALLFIVALICFFIFGFGRDPELHSETDPDADFGRDLRRAMNGRRRRRRRRFSRRNR